MPQDRHLRGRLQPPDQLLKDGPLSGLLAAGDPLPDRSFLFRRRDEPAAAPFVSMSRTCGFPERSARAWATKKRARRSARAAASGSAAASPGRRKPAGTRLPDVPDPQEVPLGKPEPAGVAGPVGSERRRRVGVVVGGDVDHQGVTEPRGPAPHPVGVAADHQPDPVVLQRPETDGPGLLAGTEAHRPVQAAPGRRMGNHHEPVVGAEAAASARRRRGLPSGTGGGRTRQAQPTPTPESGTRSGRPSARCLDDSGSGVRHRLGLHGRRRPEGRQPTPFPICEAKTLPLQTRFQTLSKAASKSSAEGFVYRAVVERLSWPKRAATATRSAPASLKSRAAKVRRSAGRWPFRPARRRCARASHRVFGLPGFTFPPGIEAGAVGVRAVLRRAGPGKPGPSLLKANPITLSKP